MNVPIDSLNNLQISNNSNISNKEHSSKGKIDMMNWFFNLSLNEKVKATTITNSTFSSLILKMYQKYTINKKHKFQIKYHKNDFTSYIDNSFIEENRVTEDLFLKEIRFFSVYNDNDSITLSASLLNFNTNDNEKKRLFQYYMMYFSKNKVFESLCQIVYDECTRTYKSTFPSWYNLTEYHTISEIFTAHFEQIINEKYRISLTSKCFYSDLNDFYEKRDSLIAYVNETSNINELIQEINLKEIIIKTLGKKNIVNNQEKKKLKQYFNTLTKSTFQLFEPQPIINYDDFYLQFTEKIVKEKEMIIDDFLFCGIGDIDSIEYHIAKDIIEEMKVKMIAKNYNDLLNEYEEEQSNNNNHKKKNCKKKRKKKQKKNKGNDNEDNHGEIDNNNSNARIIKEKRELTLIPNDKETTEGHTHLIGNNDMNTESNDVIEIKNNYLIELNNEKDNDENHTTVEQLNSSYEKSLNHLESFISNQNVIIEERKEDIKEITSIQTKDDENKQTIKSNETIEPIIKEEEEQQLKQIKLTEKELEPLKELFYNKSSNDNEIGIQLISNVSSPSDKLHNEILYICQQLNKAHSKQKNFKYTSLIFLFEKIKQCFLSELDIEIYGSYSTGLAIETSDIDISIKLITPPNNQQIVNLIMTLHTFLKKYDFFEELNPIITTSVPILRILLNPNKIITQLPNTYPSNIKIDLTFNLPSSKASTNNVKSYLNQHIEIKPLLLIFKKLIKSKQLSNVFEGGLSSHSLFLMTGAYISTIKSSKINFNLGQFFLDILRFYGNIFNFKNTVIDLSKANPFIISSDLFQVPIFIDPITQINVSKSSYRFDTVKELFKEIYIVLSSGKKCLAEIFQE